MISQQINNFDVQAMNASQMSFTGATNSVRSLSNIGQGLIGSGSAQVGGSGSGSEVAEANVAGTVSNVLGGETSGTKEQEETSNLVGQDGVNRDLYDPEKAAGHLVSGEAKPTELAEYAEKWVGQFTNYGANDEALRQFSNLGVTPNDTNMSSFNNFYQDFVGSNPNSPMGNNSIVLEAGYQNVLSINYSNGTVAYPNLTAGAANSMKNGATAVANAIKQNNQYSSTIRNNVTTAYTQTMGQAHQELNDINSTYSQIYSDNSLAYQNFNNLYQYDATTQSITDIDYQAPEFDFSPYMEQLNTLGSMGHTAQASDLELLFNNYSAANTNLVSSMSNYEQSVAMSTSDLINKYNAQATDGIMSANEIQAQYDKGFTNGKIADKVARYFA